MTRLRIFLFRLWALGRFRQSDRDIDEEINSHLTEAAEEYVRQGLSPEEARWAVRRSFGGVTQIKEVYRQVRSFMWLEDLARDLRHALRTLRKRPAFATAAVATLALAIGTNTAMFSVLNAVLLRPLPYRAPEQLAMLWTEDPTQNLREGRSALWNVEQWRNQSQSFADMATFDSVSTTLTLFRIGQGASLLGQIEEGRVRASSTMKHNTARSCTGVACGAADRARETGLFDGTAVARLTADSL